MAHIKIQQKENKMCVYLQPYENNRSIIYKISVEINLDVIKNDKKQKIKKEN